MALVVIGACELAFPVYEVDSGPDATTDASLDTANDTAIDGPIDAAPDVTACNATGLIAFFPTDEGTGASFYDCVAGKVAILSGLYKWEVRDAGPGSPHASITFMENDAGDAGGAANVPQSLYTFPDGGTLALWLRVDEYTSASQVIITTRSLNAQTEGWSLVANGDNSLSFVMGAPIGNGGTVSGPSQYSWTHIAVVIQPGASITFYLDGMPLPAQQYDAGDNIGKYPNPLFFGQEENQGGGPLGGTNAHIFNGSIGEVRIYDVPLDPSEVMTLAQQ